MADVLAGLISGFQSGQAANTAAKLAREKASAAQAKAKLDQANKDRTHNLQVATQVNTIRGAREDQMARLEDMIGSSDWTASQAPKALAFAGSIDKSYGGTAATDYLKTALNMSKTRDIVEDDDDITTEYTSKHAGYKSETQMMKSQDLRQNARTELVSGRIKKDAFAYMKANAFTDGQLDPAKTSMALIEYGAMLEAEPGMDQKVVQRVMDNFEADIARALADQAGINGEKDDFDKYVNGVSKTVTKNVRDIFASEFGFGGEITKMMEGTAPIVAEMTGIANRKAAIGWNVPQIMMHLGKTYLDKDMNWPTGVKATKYEQALSQATPEFDSAVAKFYQDPLNNQGQWEPVFDPGSRSGVMYNNETDEMVMLVGPNMDRGPDPVPVVDKPIDSSAVGAGAGIGTGKEKRIEAPMPVDAEGFPVGAKGDFYRNKRWDFTEGKWVKDESRVTEKIKSDIGGFMKKRAARQKEQKEGIGRQARGLLNGGGK